MRDVTAVESSWLVELAPHFYKQAKVGQRKELHSYYIAVTVLKRSFHCCWSNIVSYYCVKCLMRLPWRVRKENVTKCNMN